METVLFLLKLILGVVSVMIVCSGLTMVRNFLLFKYGKISGEQCFGKEEWKKIRNINNTQY